VVAAHLEHHMRAKWRPGSHIRVSVSFGLTSESSRVRSPHLYIFRGLRVVSACCSTQRSNLLANLRGMSGVMGRNLSQRTRRTVGGDLVGKLLS
jgi:hypothetical protein